jgi:hypothetical protein
MVETGLSPILTEGMTQFAHTLHATWIGWALSGLLIVLCVLWAFVGKRAFAWLTRIQGALLGLVVGLWSGLALETAKAEGEMTLALWLDVPGQLRLSLLGLAGALLGGLLLGVLGRPLARLSFLLGGGAFASLLLVLLLRLFRIPLANPLLLVLFVFLVAGALALLSSFRHPAVFTGIWGGLCAALALVWPMMRLFVRIGGPSWLPWLSAMGVGILIAIAGTALQLDKEAERQNMRS